MRYKDATAGKKGPFALMMHNGGLFDEFKDFWVETDPVGDELITDEVSGPLRGGHRRAGAPSSGAEAEDARSHRRERRQRRGIE